MLEAITFFILLLWRVSIRGACFDVEACLSSLLVARVSSLGIGSIWRGFRMNG